MATSTADQNIADLQHALNAVLAVARAQGLDQESLAARAGVRPETITSVVAIPHRAPGERSSLADPRLKLAWSNPDAPTTTLIAKAIERQSFDLILRAAWEHGIDAVAGVAQQLRDEQALPTRTLAFADRALRNIAIGAARVQPAPSH